MSFGLTPKSSDGVPLGTVIVPGNVTPKALKGGNLVTDNQVNDEASACFIRDCTVVLNQASAAQTANGNSADLSVGAFSELSVDANITSVAGTTPTLQFLIDRKGADNVYYPIWQSIIVTAVAVISVSIGAGLAIAQSFGATIRMRWIITGTTPSFTFSASIQGK